MRILVLIFSFLITFNFVFAYSESTTHPGLTDEIVDLFNLYYPELKISDEEKELAKKGSTDEDSNIRMMHHFYDPVYNRGLELAGSKWQSSKDWAEDTMGQASLLDQTFAGSLSSYFSSNADHSWSRAVYEYAWGDKKRSITDLGHILHLIEDASVPDHTRNDPHPPWFSFGSPYEAWTSQFDAEKLEGLAKSLFDFGKKPAVFKDLQECFSSMASYSNNNFFSEDSISNKIYNSPIVFFVGDFVFHDQLAIAYLKKEKKLDEPKAPVVEVYTIRDPYKIVLNNYWDSLSKQAVLHGTGVVKLFFDEVEKEKESRVLFNKNKSWFAKAYDAAKGKVFGISAILYGSSLKPSDLSELNNNVTTPNPSSMRRGDESGNPSVFQVAENTNLDAGRLSGQNGNEREITPPPPPPPVGGWRPPPLTVRGGGEVPPGGTEGGGVINLAVGPLSEGNDQPFWFPKGGAGFSSPGFGGGGSVSDAVSPPYQGGAGGGSEVAGGSEEESSEPVDTTAPEISFSISNCSSSLSSDGCLVASPSLSILWSSSSADVVSYDVECWVYPELVEGCSGFSFSATTATSTAYNLPTDEKNYQLRARARDTAGNVSSWQTINVEYHSMPVVINEIAWAGTSASSADEWIELKNRTGKSISLSGWTLYAEDLVPYINLSGTISANGYFLIERTDDNTVSDISANLVTAFSGIGSGSGLSNTGEVLILSHASTTIDQTPDCGVSWSNCGGLSSNGNPSMERFDVDASGNISSNWGTSNNVVKNGKDADGANLTATAKARNSINYQIANGGALSSNKTLSKSDNPYIIPTSQDFVVNTGATLTIEPGVVVKMGGQSSMTVSGKIVSSGTSVEPIIFTSIYDSSYGGTTNTESSAVEGSWVRVRINPPAGGSGNDSVINYTKFFYGGWYSSMWSQDLRAMLSIYESSPAISNSTFENSLSAGLRATRFNGTISGSNFSVGTTTPLGNPITDKVGLYIYEGSPTISGNTFSNNYSGLTLESTTATLESLTFSNNYIGIRSSGSTVNVANPGSIIFTGNTSTTSPGGLF